MIPQFSGWTEFIECGHGVVRRRNLGIAIRELLDRPAAGSHILQVDAAHDLRPLASGAKGQIPGFVDRWLVVAVEKLAVRAGHGVEVIHDRSPREGFRNWGRSLSGGMKTGGEQSGGDRSGEQCLGSPRDGGAAEWIWWYFHSAWHVPRAPFPSAILASIG